jgi:hypothetical protein
MMIDYVDVALASLGTLNNELAAAGRESTHTCVEAARRAVACLLNDTGDLRLYDSDTGDLITSEVCDEYVEESCLTAEGHFQVDSRRVYVAE